MKKFTIYSLLFIGIFCWLSPIYAAKNKSLTPILSILLNRGVKTLRMATGDPQVPYLVQFQDGSRYTIHTLANDKTGVLYTMFSGHVLFMVLDSEKQLRLVEIDYPDPGVENKRMFFNHVDGYMDVCLTDLTGSAFEFTSFDPDNKPVLPVAKRIAKSWDFDKVFQDIDDAWSYVGIVEGIIGGGGIKKIITDNAKDIATGTLNKNAESRGDWSKAEVDAFDVAIKSSACVATASPTACATAIISSARSLANAIKEGIIAWEEGQKSDELWAEFLERTKDKDGDGYTGVTGDCDDNNATKHRGAEEICDDGIDQDCRDGDKLSDQCGVCGGTDACLGCDDVPNSGKVNDQCGVCDGDNSTCTDCFGTINGDAYEDTCGLCRAGWDTGHETDECVCGDGGVSGDEECDDGNTVSGDGCSADCKNEGIDTTCYIDVVYAGAASGSSGEPGFNMNRIVNCNPSGNSKTYHTGWCNSDYYSVSSCKSMQVSALQSNGAAKVDCNYICDNFSLEGSIIYQ